MLSNLPRNFYIVLFLILIAGNISVYQILFMPHELKVTVAGAGKGIVVLLQQNSHPKTILINTGSDASILRVLGEHISPWQRNIDAVILTSAETRFMGGLQEIANRNYRIENLIRFGAQGSKSAEAAIAATAIAAGSTAEKDLHQASAMYGARLSFENTHIDILSPESITISYGVSILTVSSSTPSGVFISDGVSIKRSSNFHGMDGF